MFSQVHEAGFQRLATMAVVRRFEKGERIFREGQECPGTYVVGEGLVRVFKTAPNGKEHVLHMVGPGNTFAEVACIGQFNVPASAQAVSETTCALLPADRFVRLMHEDHQLCLDMMASLTMWVRHLIELMGDVVLRDAAGRLARYLLDAPTGPDGRVELPGLKRHIASHLNLTSETFSRTLRRFLDSGLVGEEGDALRVLDAEGLHRVAEGQFPRL